MTTPREDTIAALRAWVATKREVASEATVTYGEHAVGYYDALGIVLAEIDRLWVAAEADRATPERRCDFDCDACSETATHTLLDLDSPEAATPTALDVLLIAGAPLLRDAYAAYIVRGWLHSPEAAERLATYLAVEFGKAGFYRPGVSMEFLTQQARLILADVLAATGTEP